MFNIRNILVAVMILGNSIFLFAANARGYSRLYDAQTVTNLNGKVTRVEVLKSRGPDGGVHLQLKTDKEEISVHLGPSWFLNGQNLNIKKDDVIEVKGSRVIIENRPAIIAAEIHQGDKMVILRDQDGVPVWSGWRKRGPSANQ
ncbi:MAG: hypothetical protein A2X86_12700 [Bdellovibrionales bacterium GWA2_49_15]|nr:MAG: hypothetical protein A2X86_12700 [Bdellovibrionales bacterium GWA2_49_15]HAZ14712.1 DNA-binding protein [Bdellovibrionales bacterium]